jgi:hypothetical protein
LLQPLYFYISNGQPDPAIDYKNLRNYLCRQKRQEKLANRIVVNTPDPFINTLGGHWLLLPMPFGRALHFCMVLLPGVCDSCWRGPYLADEPMA